MACGERLWGTTRVGFRGYRAGAGSIGILVFFLAASVLRMGGEENTLSFSRVKNKHGQFVP